MATTPVQARDETWQGRHRVPLAEGEQALDDAATEHENVLRHQTEESDAVKRRRAAMLKANENGVTMDAIADRLKLSLSVVRKQLVAAREERDARKPKRRKGSRHAA